MFYGDYWGEITISAGLDEKLILSLGWMDPWHRSAVKGYIDLNTTITHLILHEACDPELFLM